MRRVALILLVSLPLWACERPVETFDFTLHLNLAGDELLLSDLDSLSVEVTAPGEDPVQQTWDPFDTSATLEVPEVPRGSDIVIRLEGVVAEGTADEQLASGQTAPLELPEQEEAWVLFHRHPSLVRLEGGSDVPRLGHKVFAVPDGAVVVGGETGDGYAPISQLVRTEHQGYALEEVDSGPEHSGFAAAMIRGGALDGQILIAGGNTSVDAFTGVTDRYHVWDPEDGEYTAEDESLDEARYGAVAAALSDASDGKVSLVGGIYASTFLNVDFTDWVQTLDPDTDDVELAHLNRIAWLHSATVWGPDTVLACGGYERDPWEGYVSSDRCDQIFPSSGDVSAGYGVLNQGRAAHRAVALGEAGDELLLVGGTDLSQSSVPDLDVTDGALDTADVVSQDIDVLTSELVSMIHPRIHPVVVRLPAEDRVLVCGGHDGISLRSDCEFYDENTGVFTEAVGLELPVPLYQVEAAALADGTALLVGGDLGGAAAADMAVVYLP